MKHRLVIPEILDSLPADDPLALRCRRDLIFINAVIGNYRWLSRRILRVSRIGGSDWVELGAGDGPLAASLPEGSDESVKITGVDLAPRPVRWPENWGWIEGDLFETLPRAQIAGGRGGLAANLFLHHFCEEELGRIGSLMNDHFSRLVFVEPARYRIFRILGFVLFPFVNSVTRHDLQISIGAGFRRGELKDALKLDPSWQVEERVTLLGACRFEAWKG